MSMNLNLWRWQWFCLDKLFDIWAGKYYYKDDYSDWNTPYCSAAATNNWIVKKIDIEPDFPWNQIVTWKVWCTAFYQPEPFCATSDVNVLTPRFSMDTQIWLFITSVINAWENYKWNYWRQCRVWDTKWISIKLPVQYNPDWTQKIDETKKYSDEWYIPDWQFMEDYIKSLHHKPITTKIKNNHTLTLNIDKWKEFYIWDIFNVKYWINMELDSCTKTDTTDNEAVAFVARTWNNNWVTAFVKPVEDKIPQKAWTITCAWWWSVLSTFVQKHDFYSWRDLYLLTPKEYISLPVKLFLSTIIEKNKYRFSYWRQANKTLPFLIIKLPIQHNPDWTAKIDKTKKYSEEWYIPDWQFMEKYIKNLPYWDRI